jgi:subtilisin family serine protease
MRRALPLAALLSVSAFAACDNGTPTDARGAGGAVAARSENAPVYLVTFNDNVADVRGAAADIARGNGLALRHVREFAARGFSAVIPAARIEQVRNDPRVKLVEPDYVVQLVFPVEVKARPGGGGSTGQTTPWGITRVGGAGDGTGKTAWILDTGVDLSNPDLNTTKACHTYFAGNSPDDGNGHGTHVAGTIAAKNNSIDVVGVAANAYVCSVRVLGNSGSGTYEGIVNGVNYVAAHGANGDVANMSLGGTGSNATLENAIRDAAAKGI